MLSKLLDNLGPHYGLFGDGSGFTGGGGTAPIKSIQYVTVTFGGADLTKDATITAVVLANSFVLHLGQVESDPKGLTTVALQATTNVRFTKNASGSATTHKAVVVEFAAGIVKSNQDFSIVNNSTAAISSVDTTKALLIPRGRTFDNVALDFYDILTHLVLTNATTVTATRYNPVGNVTTAGTVIEFI